MTKPKIIGWEFDYASAWDRPQMPEISIDHDGEMSIPVPMVDHTGYAYEGRQVIEPEQQNAFMRFHGWQPKYAPRPFRATPTHDGYRLNGWKLYCRNCKTATMSTVRLPHDLAVTHECLYDPAQVEQS